MWQGFGLGEDNRGRWRCPGARAGQSGAAVEPGCGGSMKTPPCSPSAPVSSRPSSVTRHARAQADEGGGDKRQRWPPARGWATSPSSACRHRRALQPEAGGRQRSGEATALWGLTFDMSGGPKGAKRPLERPLDGGVRPHRTAYPRSRRMAQYTPMPICTANAENRSVTAIADSELR